MSMQEDRKTRSVSRHLLSQLGKDPSYSSGSTLLSTCIQLTQRSQR